MAAGIEAACPAPRIFPGRHAGAERDRAHAHVTVEHVPAFVGGVWRAAAGELGHALLKRGPSGQTINLRAKIARLLPISLGRPGTRKPRSDSRHSSTFGKKSLHQRGWTRVKRLTIWGKLRQIRSARRKLRIRQKKALRRAMPGLPVSRLRSHKVKALFIQ
jgi:hypothetical protein